MTRGWRPRTARESRPNPSPAIRARAQGAAVTASNEKSPDNRGDDLVEGAAALPRHIPNLREARVGGGLSSPSAQQPRRPRRRWNWRQGRRTQLTDDTTRAVFVFYRPDGLTVDELNHATDELSDVLLERWPDGHLDRVKRHATWPQHDLIDRGHVQAAHRLQMRGSIEPRIAICNAIGQPYARSHPV